MLGRASSIVWHGTKRGRTSRVCLAQSRYIAFQDRASCTGSALNLASETFTV